MVVVVVKVPETITEVTNVCMTEYCVCMTDVGIEVTGTVLGGTIGVNDEVALVATVAMVAIGVAGL